MFDEHEIRTFVYGTTRYFEVAAQQPATVGSPYLVTQGAPETAEYTGIINITGRRNGIVYFTAPRGMLIVMLMKMNESDVSHDNLCDLVGEVANTISGNARRDFGKEFMISAPEVVCRKRQGRAAARRLPAVRDPDQLAESFRQAGGLPQVVRLGEQAAPSRISAKPGRRVAKTRPRAPRRSGRSRPHVPEPMRLAGHARDQAGRL